MKNTATIIACIIGLVFGLWAASGAKPGTETDQFKRVAATRSAA